MKNKNKRWAGTLEQFIDHRNGNIITYKFDAEGALPYAYALFRVYRKKQPTFLERVKIYLGFKYVLTKGSMTCSQVNGNINQYL